MSGTWTGRWRDALDDGTPQVARRVNKGRGYERSGRVSDVRVHEGRLSGRVQGSKATPHLVEVDVPVFDDATWERVVGALATEVRHSAQLLAGQAPEGLEAELAAAGVTLFPSLTELSFACPCGDAVVPCPHAAALWEAAAARLDADPFVLLRLRGRGRARLLSDLAAARRAVTRASQPQQGIDSAALPLGGWSRAAVPLDALELPVLPPPRTPAPALRLLGDPPVWAGAVTAWELLGPLVARAADWAREREL